MPHELVNEWPVFNLLISKDTIHDSLKWHKFGENKLNSFWVLIYSAKTLENLQIFSLSHFDDVIKSTWRWRHHKFLSICKDFHPHFILAKFHLYLTWNSPVRTGDAFCPPPSLFRLAKTDVKKSSLSESWTLCCQKYSFLGRCTVWLRMFEDGSFWQ